MIPDGWSKTDLLSLSSNGLMNGAFNDPKLVGTGYKLINVVNLYSEPCIKTTELELLNLPSSDYEKFKADKYDIFFTRSSLKLEGIAHCNIFLDDREDVIFECHIIRARPDKSKVDPRYLHYFCVSPNARKHFMSYAKTTTMTTIDQNGIGSLNVLLPPLLEQCRIAEVLGVWDESIDLLERLIGRVRSRKQGLMQQLLTGKKRFKEFEGSEWKNTFIKKVAKLTAGGTPDTNIVEYWNGDIPWMKSGDVNLRKIHKVDGRITQSGFDNSSTKKIPPHSVLIALAGQGKTRGLVAINEIELCTNQSIAAIMPNPSKLYFEYLYYNLESRYQELRALSSGDGGRGGLNLKILGQIEICLPSLPEQEKIAAVLSAADEEISTLEKQLAAYKQQKLGLMQQLLTGKIRVGMIQGSVGAGLC